MQIDSKEILSRLSMLADELSASSSRLTKNADNLPDEQALIKYSEAIGYNKSSLALREFIVELYEEINEES